MTRRSVPLILVGIVLISINLRPAAVSVGPVLDEVRGAFAMSGASAGLLTSLPVIAFAVFGALAPQAARRLGAHRVTLLALVAVVVGLFARAIATSEIAFLAFSMLSLSGMAMGNVLLPSLIKLHFPDRIGRMTALYTTALGIGTTAPLMLTMPIAQSFDNWRWGLGLWAGLALVAVVPWIALARHDRHLERRRNSITFSQVAGTRIGWAMALFFGLQSTHAYTVFGWFPSLWRDAGFSAGQAGALVGLLSAMGIPLAFLVPPYVARLKDPRWFLLGIMLCYPIGYIGMMIAPVDLAIVWAIVIGLATASFPVALLMIGLRSRTPSGTAALSSFTQSVGYLVAAVGPFGLGLLHDLADNWTVPLIVLAAVAIPQIVVGMYIARPHYVEDQLRDAVPAGQSSH